VTERRKLSFASFDEVIADVERLRANGYTRAGNWDLSQCCGHLTAWLTYPVSGFPKAPLPIRMMLGVVRPLLGKKMLAKYLAEGMPTGKPTMPQSVVASGDEAKAVEELKAAMDRFQAHAGEYLPSPLFGQLSRDEALKVQLAHCSHHLSFLIPK
jgi:hypothetical protein